MNVNKNELIEVLAKSRDILSTSWTSGVYAEKRINSHYYETCFPLDPGACKFCAVGAIAHVVGVPVMAVEKEYPPRDKAPPSPLAHAAYLKVSDAMHLSPTIGNDNLGKIGTLNAFDDAIRKLQEQGVDNQQ